MISPFRPFRARRPVARIGGRRRVRTSPLGELVVVGLAFSLGGLFSGCATTPSDSPSSSSSGATATPGPGPTGARLAEAWRSASDSPVIASVQLLDAVWTGQRFLATGSALGGAGAFIDSSDGSLWHLQPLLDSSAQPAVLAAGPAGVVAIGRIDDRPASWSSPDGLTWTAQTSAFPGTVDGNDVSVTAAVATSDGWLAVGRADPRCNINCGLDPRRALVWTSTDGLDWVRVADQDAFAKAAMTGVTRTSVGYIAVGFADDHAAVWTSAEGSIWSRVPDSPPFRELPSPDPSRWTQMTAVASGHGVTVAVGRDGPGGAHGPAGRAWWSVDGRVWSKADGEAFQVAGDLSVDLSDVIATPGGFLAVAGSHGACTSGIWTATDGSFWRCEATDALSGSMTAYAGAASDTVEIVVGLDSSREPGVEGYPGAVWVTSLR